MSEVMVNTRCTKCRESEDAIWIQQTWGKGNSEKYEECFICESCYGHWEGRSGRKVVKGSQWEGQEVVGHAIYT